MSNSVNSKFRLSRNFSVCTSISLINLMKQYSFKIAETSLNNISTSCQVADQLLQQNIERWFFLLVFNYVVFINFYERSFC